MFDFSFPELLIVLLVALVVVKPEDVPAVVRAFKAGMRRLRGWRAALRAEMGDAFGETDRIRRGIADFRIDDFIDDEASRPYERYPHVRTEEFDVSRQRKDDDKEPS
jgi:Sec-independent protein translocase protein TatA